MEIRAGGALRRATGWATHPYLGLCLAAGGLVVAAGPRDAPTGHARIEDVPPGVGWERTEAWAKRHRDACANCRRAFEDARRKKRGWIAGQGASPDRPEPRLPQDR